MRQDLANNTEQLTEFRKRPQLNAVVTLNREAPENPQDRWRPYCLTFDIWNDGTRIARSVTLEILWKDSEAISRMGQPPTAMIDGFPYYVVRRNDLAASPLYPNGTATALQLLIGNPTWARKNRNLVQIVR